MRITRSGLRVSWIKKGNKVEVDHFPPYNAQRRNVLRYAINPGMKRGC